MRFQLVPAAYVFLIRYAAGRREVLLQLRQNTGYRDGWWAAGAAGHVEAGESAIDCAVREVREELGVCVVASDLVPMTVLHRTDGTDEPIEQRVDFMFTCRVWDGEPTAAEAHKVADMRWFALDSLPENLAPTERFVIEGWRGGTLPAIAALGF